MTKTIDLIDSLLPRAINAAQSLRFDAKYMRHLVVVSLYMTILELVEEIVSANRESSKISVPIISRSILEAFVDLKNVVTDEDYCNIIELDWLRGWKLTMENALTDNPYLVDIKADPNLKEGIEEHERRLNELKELGTKKLTAQQKFEKAGLANEYETMYRWTSSHSHGGLQALISRHINLSNPEKPEVVAFQDHDIEEFEIYIGPTCEILMQATELAHQFLESSESEVVKEMRGEVDAHRREIST